MRAFQKKWKTLIIPLSLVNALFGISFLEICGANAQASRFIGTFVVTPLPDGRKIKLVQPLTYVDGQGGEWPVPAGFVSDGATVPRFAWSFFPPLSGKYRIAAVVHDYYCQQRNRPWLQVHRVFFDAMRTSGVDIVTAKIMYAAVVSFGPRWDKDGNRTRAAGTQLSQTEQKQRLQLLSEWIKISSPELEEVKQKALWISR